MRCPLCFDSVDEPSVADRNWAEPLGVVSRADGKRAHRACVNRKLDAVMSVAIAQAETRQEAIKSYWRMT